MVYLGIKTLPLGLQKCLVRAYWTFIDLVTLVMQIWFIALFPKNLMIGWKERNSHITNKIYILV